MTVLQGAASTPVGVGGESTMVLFDWNGTVVRDADRARDALNAALAARGLPVVSALAFPAVFRLPMHAMFRDLGVPPDECGLAEDDWNGYMSSHPTTLREAAGPCLTALADSGVWLGVVSAASREAVEFDLRSLGLPRLFDSIEAPVVDKVAALAAHRGRRQRAFYVGDTVYDMRSAVAAGYVPVAVSGGYAPEQSLLEAGAAHLISSLSTLATLALRPHSEGRGS